MSQILYLPGGQVMVARSPLSPCLSGFKIALDPLGDCGQTRSLMQWPKSPEFRSQKCPFGQGYSTEHLGWQTLLKWFLNFTFLQHLKRSVVSIHNYFFNKWAIPGLFLNIFGQFQIKTTIFTTNQGKNCPSSIWCWDTNPQPSQYRSSPITTRPGLPPCFSKFTSCLMPSGNNDPAGERES